MLDSATKDAEMEQRLTIVTLGVADLKRSTEFYERLGWRRSDRRQLELPANDN
jgi:catechol 2,3-dioxygenase-like lactoylglutathione lyase family enzyme